MDVTQIYQEAKRGTASGRGPSYWQTPMLCGKKAALTAQHKEIYDGDRQSDAMRTGTFYHFLHEIYQTGRLEPETVIDASSIQDPSWCEAVRLFQFVQGQRSHNYFGKTVGTEVRLPVNEEHKATLEDFFGIYGEDCPTGQIDLLVSMSSSDVARIEADRNVELRGPGLYIVDYKTAAARASDMSARADYTQTVQSMTYPLLWNLAGGEQIKGMIFDVIVKHKKLGDNSMQTFVSYPCPTHGPIIRNAVRTARASKLKARANPYACFYKGYECTFLKNSLCGRM